MVFGKIHQNERVLPKPPPDTNESAILFLHALRPDSGVFRNRNKLHFHGSGQTVVVFGKIPQNERGSSQTAARDE